VNAWTELLMLPKCVLCAPPQNRSTNEAGVAAFTLDRLSRWEAGERATLWHDCPRYKRATPNSSEESCKARAVTYAREGLDSKACAALTASQLAQENTSNAAKLGTLHPPAEVPPRTPAANLAFPPSIGPDLVAKCLHSFPQGSAPGPSGMRVQHLLDALTPGYKSTLVEQLTALVTLLALGHGPDEVRPHLAGAKLFGATKKDGGIRPIAVGEALRRLVAKTLCETSKQEARNHLWPLQVGCGSPLGAEIAVHTLRQWCLRNAGSDKVLLKIDCSNAFNCISRSAVLHEIHEHFPRLARWTGWCYAVRSNLVFGSTTVPSLSGVQQGDPLGPLLFSLGIQPLAKTLAMQGRNGQEGQALDLTLFYLDDGVVCGSPQAVADALTTITRQATTLGLSLNLAKCELVAVSEAAPPGLESMFPEALLKDLDPTANTFGRSRVLLGGNFEILGAPIGSASFCAAHTNTRVKKAFPTLAALADLDDPQVALRLQRRCQGFAKLSYSTRIVPSTDHLSELQAFDAEQRNTFAGYTGWSPSNSQWAQATRGFKYGGLGLRSAAAHAASAFLASYTTTLRYCKELDPNYQWEGSCPSTAVHKALRTYNASVAEDDRLSLHEEPERALRQQALSQAIDNKQHNEYFNSLNDSDRKALLSEQLQGAYGFLDAIPSKDLGLAWAPAEFIIEIRTRLLDDLFPEDSWCPACDSILDKKGRHPAVCPCWGDRTRRHHAARNRVAHFASSAGLNPEIEKPGLLQPSPEQPGADRRRPADVFVPGWPAALDLAITSPHRLDAPPATSSTAGAAAAAYEGSKRSYLQTAADCEAQGFQFRPIVGEPSGGWGPSAICTFKAIAKAQAQIVGSEVDAGRILSNELQHLCTAVRRANARAVLSRSFDAHTCLSTTAADAIAILSP